MTSTDGTSTGGTGDDATRRGAVLVTGCSSGIGHATAARLVADGHVVYATARRPETLESLAAAGAHPLELDVTDESSMRTAVAEVEREHGAVGVLVNNAGYGEYGPVEEVPLEAVRRQFETNVFGLGRMCQLVLPGMRAAGRGRIVNIGSMGGRITFPTGGWYHASKYAVEALTDALRVELSTTGARAGCAYFGFIDTDLVRASFAQSSTQTLQGNMPAFIRKPVPVGKAVDAIERAVDKRLARTWAPRFVGGFLALRGILQPLSEKRLMGSPELAAAIAEADAAGATEGDLGVAGQLVS